MREPTSNQLTLAERLAAAVVGALAGPVTLLVYAVIAAAFILQGAPLVV